MKRILIIAAAALFMAAAPQTASAQDNREPQEQNYRQRRGAPREQMTPEQMAKRTTDRLNEVVELNEKQYKKIYNFHLELIDQYPNSEASVTAVSAARGLTAKCAARTTGTAPEWALAATEAIAENASR